MRSAVTLFVAYLLLILQSTVLELASVHMVTPSLGLLVVLHVGLSSKWTISSASVVAFATGYLFDLVSGAPQGVHAFVFVLMALFARGLTTRLAVQGIVLSAVTAFVASLIASALIVIVRAQVAPEGGYGLWLTDTLAQSWGVIPADGGRARPSGSLFRSADRASSLAASSASV